MDEGLRKIKKQYFTILIEFLGIDVTEDLLKTIFTKDSSINASSNQASKVIYNPRYSIDRIITYAKEKLTLKKHLNLLLNLAKLSL